MHFIEPFFFPPEFYNNKQCKLALTVCIILAVAGIFTIVEVCDSIHVGSILFFYKNWHLRGLHLCGMYCVSVQGVMEYEKLLTLPCDDFEFFTHGGMIFLFSTSIIFTFVSSTVVYRYFHRLKYTIECSTCCRLICSPMGSISLNCMSAGAFHVS